MNTQNITPSTKTIITENNTRPIVLFIADEKTKTIKHQLKKLNGVYNETGWFIEQKFESILKDILEKYSITYIEMPLPAESKTFSEFKQINEHFYIKLQLSEIDDEIKSKKTSFNSDELQPLFDKRKKLIEKSTNKNNISIIFLHENNINYLTQEAPEAPVLLSIMDEGGYKPFIRKGIVGMVAGIGGIGKTHLLTQLTLAIASGSQFLGNHFSTPEIGNVFLGLGENTNDDIWRLLKKISNGLNLTKTQLQKISTRLAPMSFAGKQASFVDRYGNVTPFFESFFEALKEREPENGWSLITLDPISRFLGPEAEINNGAATNFIALLEKFTIELKGKPTVLFGHHMNKSAHQSEETNQGSARGSSAITDGVRWQANLEKSPNNKSEAILRVTKSNHTKYYDPILLHKNENGILSYAGIYDENNSNKPQPTPKQNNLRHKSLYESLENVDEK